MIRAMLVLGLGLTAGCSFEGRGLPGSDGPPVIPADATGNPADATGNPADATGNPADARPFADAKPPADAKPRADARPDIDAMPPPIDAEPTCEPGLVLVQDEQAWRDAEDDCEDRGMHLVVISDSAEHQEVIDLLDESPPPNNQVWLGFTDLSCGDGDFVAVTGEEVDLDEATNQGWGWESGEPSNGGQSNNSMDGAENCALLKENNGKWNDASCTQERHYYLCECDDLRADAAFYTPPDEGGQCPDD